jgi:hypothetical protein
MNVIARILANKLFALGLHVSGEIAIWTLGAVLSLSPLRVLFPHSASSHRWQRSLVRLAMATRLAADFAGRPAHQILGKVERPDERASKLTRTKQMNRTASFNCHICKT